MARGFSKTTIYGNLGADPELRYSKNGGLAIANVRVAVNERVKRGDDWEDQTTWYRAVFFGGAAETVAEYMHKGDSILIHGSMNFSTYEKELESGEVVEMPSWELKAREFIMGGGSGSGSGSGGSSSGRSSGRSSSRSSGRGRSRSGGEVDDELPFEDE